jgi:hypothetical protein
MAPPPRARVSRFVGAEDITTLREHDASVDLGADNHTPTAHSPIPSEGNISRLTTLRDYSDEALQKSSISPALDSSSDKSSQYSPTKDIFDRMQPRLQLASGYVSFSYPTRSDIVGGRNSWIPLALLLLSVVGTVMSTIAAVVAHRSIDFKVGKSGGLSLASATSICAALAKLNEMTLVTLIVAIIGQTLSRRLYAGRGSGVSIAEMNMRAWITQPGSVFNNLASTFRTANIYLGAITLWTTVVAMLYTTAAEALIYPKLRMRDLAQQKLYGTVRASFANVAFLKESCKTPIGDTDADKRGTACFHISFAGQSFHNFQSFLAQWDTLPNGGNGTDLLTLEVPAQENGGVVLGSAR